LILAFAIVAGLVWMAYSLVTRRGHRIALKEGDPAVDEGHLHRGLAERTH